MPFGRLWGAGYFPYYNRFSPFVTRQGAPMASSSQSIQFADQRNSRQESNPKTPTVGSSRPTTGGPTTPSTAPATTFTNETSPVQETNRASPDWPVSQGPWDPVSNSYERDWRDTTEQYRATLDEPPTEPLISKDDPFCWVVEANEEDQAEHSTVVDRMRTHSVYAPDALDAANNKAWMLIRRLKVRYKDGQKRSEPEEPQIDFSHNGDGGYVASFVTQRKENGSLVRKVTVQVLCVPLRGPNSDKNMHGYSWREWIVGADDPDTERLNREFEKTFGSIGGKVKNFFRQSLRRRN